MAWSLWAGALAQGLIFGFLAWGVFLSFRVVRFTDITVDGSFTLGAATGAVLLLRGTHPLEAMAAAFGAGCVAGVVTATLHTRLGVADLLSGILTMTALYSINLRVMGQSNLGLDDDTPTLLSLVRGWGEGIAANASAPLLGLKQVVASASDDLLWLAILGVLGIAFWMLIAWFLRTDYGMALRATGDSSSMIASQGVDVRLTKTVALALSNGLAAFSGALMMQYGAMADIGMGLGSLITGLAAVILGETFLGRRSMLWMLLGVLVGSVLFRALIALALQARLDPNDLRLATAVFVLAALALPRLWTTWRDKRRALPPEDLSSTRNARAEVRL